MRTGTFSNKTGPATQPTPQPTQNPPKPQPTQPGIDHVIQWILMIKFNQLNQLKLQL